MEFFHFILSFSITLCIGIERVNGFFFNQDKNVSTGQSISNQGYSAAPSAANSYGYGLYLWHGPPPVPGQHGPGQPGQWYGVPPPSGQYKPTESNYEERAHTKIGRYLGRMLDEYIKVHGDIGAALDAVAERFYAKLRQVKEGQGQMSQPSQFPYSKKQWTSGTNYPRYSKRQWTQYNRSNSFYTKGKWTGWSSNAPRYSKREWTQYNRSNPYTGAKGKWTGWTSNTARYSKREWTQNDDKFDKLDKSDKPDKSDKSDNAFENKSRWTPWSPDNVYDSKNEWHENDSKSTFANSANETFSYYASYKPNTLNFDYS